jgi:hypothetical protein
MLAILVGVRREHEAIERNISVLERTQTDDGYFISVGEYANRPLLICRTHMGEDRVKGIADRIFQQYPVSSVVSARMGVGIANELNLGDIAICQRTFLWRAPGVFRGPSPASDFRLMEIAGRAAQSVGIGHMVGNALTVEPAHRRSEEERELDSEHSIVAADTDGYWLAEAAAAHELPYLSVRASLADVYERMPRMLELVGPKASVSPFRVLREALAHPAEFPNIVKLADAVRHACASLGRFSEALLRQLAETPLPAPDRQR